MIGSIMPISLTVTAHGRLKNWSSVSGAEKQQVSVDPIPCDLKMICVFVFFSAGKVAECCQQMNPWNFVLQELV